MPVAPPSATDSTGLVASGTQTFTIHVTLASSVADGTVLADSATVAITDVLTVAESLAELVSPSLSETLVAVSLNAAGPTGDSFTFFNNHYYFTAKNSTGPALYTWSGEYQDPPAADGTVLNDSATVATNGTTDPTALSSRNNCRPTPPLWAAT